MRTGTDLAICPRPGCATARCSARPKHIILRRIESPRSPRAADESARSEDHMDDSSNASRERTALITGASRGLGVALARGLARRRWNLIIDGRDADRLRVVRNELAGITHVAALAGDVSDPD